VLSPKLAKSTLSENLPHCAGEGLVSYANSACIAAFQGNTFLQNIQMENPSSQ